MMRTAVLKRRAKTQRHIFFPALIGFLLITMTASSAWSEELIENAEKSGPKSTDEPTVEATEEELTEFPIDISEMVDVKVSGSLRTEKHGRYYLSVAIQNLTEGPIPGPISLTIKGTSLEQLVATESGLIPFLPAEGRLKAGRKTESKKVTFQASERLTAVQRSTLKLDWTVTRELPQDEPVANDEYEKLLASKSYSLAEMNRVMEVQDRWTDKLMKHKGVMGTATAEDANGNLIIQVLAMRSGLAQQLPREIEGIPVKVRAMGPITAGPASPSTSSRPTMQPTPDPVSTPEARNDADPQTGPGGNPRQRFPRPAPIGVSTSNITDCLSGTLGFRATGRDGQKYLVSNNHVWAAGNSARTGDRVLQPSRGDNRCARDTNDTIGTFADFQPIRFDGSTNTIDAALVRMTPGQVAASTPDDGYGFPSSTPTRPLINMQVQKYGRTTGLTSGRIYLINATVNVQYGAGKIGTFRGQIGIRDTNGAFSRGGDSGSLIVSQNGKHPVALLYAGGGNSTFGNPIQSVLSRFNLTVDSEGPGGPEPTPGAKVGNQVWFDTNNNGLRDRTELGSPGVEVRLISPGPDEEIGGGDDILIGRTRTSSSGFYRFDDVADGEYYMIFIIPRNRKFTTLDVGDNDNIDSDVDPDTNRTALFTISDGADDLTRDGGLTFNGDPRTGRIGNRVWFDRNRNGQQDYSPRWAREGGVRGVTVILMDAGGDGQIGGGDDVEVKRRRTNNSGFYLFTNLPAGNYYLRMYYSSRYTNTRPNIGISWLDSNLTSETSTDVFQLEPGRSDYSQDAGLRFR